MPQQLRVSTGGYSHHVLNHRLVFLRFFLVCCACLPLGLGFGPAPAQAEPVRIHLVVVADTQDRRIGESVRVDFGKIQEVFRANVPPAQLQIEALSGRSVVPSLVLRSISGLAIESGVDTVVFYFSGHGEFDRQSNDHVLLPRGRALPVKQVQSALQQLRPRLTVVIFDACSSFIRTGVGAPAFPPAERISEAFKSLFVDPAGLIVISSSRPGQQAVGDSNGGYFTSALLFHLVNNTDNRLAWPCASTTCKTIQPTTTKRR